MEELNHLKPVTQRTVFDVLIVFSDDVVDHDSVINNFLYCSKFLYRLSNLKHRGNFSRKAKVFPNGDRYILGGKVL